MKQLILTATLIGTLVSFGSAMAQDSRIHDRKVEQQERIANGVKSGSLSPAETARLEHKEGAINKEIRHDRRVNGGNLTNREKKQINRQQNRVSKDIYKQKHDNNNK